MIFLLDTNTWVEYLRQRNANVVRRIQAANPADLHLCSVVLGELYFGAYRSPSSFQAHNLALLTRLSGQFISLPFENTAADHYGQIRANLEARGLPIGPNDLIIAAIAIANAATLVTHNTAEFGRVSGLLLEDWHI